MGADIIVHFARWPRDWQVDADWLRFRDQGGHTREVLSHFLYVTQRLLGPATLISAKPVYPADTALCETHISATLDCNGVPVSVLGSSGGVGPDRVEMTIWGSQRSHRLHDWFCLQSSDGGEWHQELHTFLKAHAASPQSAGAGDHLPANEPGARQSPLIYPSG